MLRECSRTVLFLTIAVSSRPTVLFFCFFLLLISLAFIFCERYIGAHPTERNKTGAECVQVSIENDERTSDNDLDEASGMSFRPGVRCAERDRERWNGMWRKREGEKRHQKYARLVCFVTCLLVAENDFERTTLAPWWTRSYFDQTFQEALTRDDVRRHSLLTLLIRILEACIKSFSAMIWNRWRQRVSVFSPANY